MKQFFQVDTFTRQAFCGNTAGVVVLEEELPESIMKKLAAQNRLPAIAFVHPSNASFMIRWFTPNIELPLCGHATLAAAHILFSNNIVAKTQSIHFLTKNGDLSAQWVDDWIRMDFPAFTNTPVSISSDLKSIFNAKIKASAKTLDRYIIELEDEADVKNFIPDDTVLKKYKCILTSRAAAGADYDFVSRYFASPDGVGEDAVTGSSHCSLVPYWAERLGKLQLHAFQVSERGGELRLSYQHNRVFISGQAITVMEGKLNI